MELNIVDMYSDILNMYGDMGNVKIIKQRCLWRGIDVNIHNFTKGKNNIFDPNNTDMILIGGGSDHGQSLVSKHLLKQRNLLQEYIDNGGVVLAICGSYQMFGNKYLDVNGDSIPCLEIFDIETIGNENRLIGDIVIENNLNLNPKTIVGFENHGGRTYHDYTPLGSVKIGNGNNGEDGMEGMIYKNFIGTYLHGPILPKNPHIADKLIKESLNQKYGDVDLEKLNDNIELKAHQTIVNRLLNK